MSVVFFYGLSEQCEDPGVILINFTLYNKVNFIECIRIHDQVTVQAHLMSFLFLS